MTHRYVPLFGLLVATVACLFFSLHEKVIPDHEFIIPVKINRRIWTQPVDADYVRVLFNYRQGTRPFGHEINRTTIKRFQNGSRLAFGHMGHHDVILIRPGIVPHINHRIAFIVASHEAFHLAIQFDMLRPRLDSTGQPKLGSKKQWLQLQKLEQVLFTSLKTHKGVCVAIHKIQLSPAAVKRYFRERSYTEWPAEWYMRHASMPNKTFLQYFKLRRSWGRGHANLLYVDGLLALDKVDSTMGRVRWQRKYMDGAHPVNMLSSVYGCSAPFGSSFQVKRTLDGIFNQ